MKITRVEPILIAVPYEHGGPKPMRPSGPWTHMETLFVRVDTDANITGWGEAFGFAASPLTREAITRAVAPLCVGREFKDVPSFMADLQRKLHAMGRHGSVSFALAGIDIALWDILGKAQNMPVHRLLGGATRDRIPTYASLLRYGKSDLVGRYTQEAIARGYEYIKLHEHLVETIAPGREAAGPNIPIMVDTNCAWPPDEALAMARKLKAYDLYWLEEPVDPVDDYDAMARIRRDTGMTVAAGENIGHAGEARYAMELGALDIFQPSITKIGGIIAMRKAIAVAKDYGVRVMPHSPYFGPGLIATLHVIAADLPDSLCERFYCELEATPLGNAVAARDGHMMVPQAPGLGIEIDEDVIARYRLA
ncbi:MAG TPA: mandelate racemase/muconate lactonizing enzyme family protein [Xanthobacteraceae bacterium]|nr:mandelate racemase/muconate lactonizing enzyme family protein [Xanthobacteraceae bacterium]